MKTQDGLIALRVDIFVQVLWPFRGNEDVGDAIEAGQCWLNSRNGWRLCELVNNGVISNGKTKDCLAKANGRPLAGRSGRDVDLELVSRLKYVNNCFKASWRLTYVQAKSTS